MQIKISGYEVEEAILEFVNKKYGHSFEISKHDRIQDCDDITFYVKELADD